MSDVLVVAPIHEDALQLMRDSGLEVTDARGKSPDELRELLKTHRALLGRAGSRSTTSCSPKRRSCAWWRSVRSAWIVSTCRTSTAAG